MKYDLTDTYSQKKALEYLEKLIESGSKCEVKKIHPKRSTSQNSYLHVLFTLWANEFGYTVDEAKHTVKHALSYTYQKKAFVNGHEERTNHDEKTSDMDSKELTQFIEKFRNWSADTCSLYLPSADEYVLHQINIDNQIEQ